MKFYSYKFALTVIMTLTVGIFSSYASPQDIHDDPTLGPINRISTENHFHICNFISSPSDFESLAQVSSHWDQVTRVVYTKIPASLIVVGELGCGNTTFVHLLAGKQLSAQRDDLRRWQFSCNEKLGDIVIGNDTKQPTCIVDLDQNRRIWDCPDMIKNLGPEKDFQNALKIHDLLKGRVKVIVSISAGTIEVMRGSHALKSLNLISEIFEDQDELNKSVALVITKRYQKESLAYLLDSLQDGANLAHIKFFSQKARDLLQYLIDHPNQIIDFPQPDLNGDYTLNDNLSWVLNKSTYIKDPVVTFPLEESLKHSKWCNTDFYY